MNDIEVDPAHAAWLQEQADIEEMVDNGLLVELMHCYLCYLEATGKADYDGDKGPLRGIIKRGTSKGFDPYATYTLTCGHSLI